MVENIFEDTAKKEGATFNSDEDVISMFDGGRRHSMSYSLTVNYKGRIITIKNECDTSQAGIIKCLMSDKRDSLGFEMTTRSHFLSLFFRGNRFKLSKHSPI